MQQGDVKLFNTVNGGEISVTGGLVTMASGLETAAYLSLFGGNQNDAGGDDRRFTWWGNINETDPAKTYRSETQNIIDSLPATTANLLRLKEAAERDLAWFVSEGAASAVTVTATIPALNTVRLVVSIVADGDEQKFIFSENWKASI